MTAPAPRPGAAEAAAAWAPPPWLALWARAQTALLPAALLALVAFVPWAERLRTPLAPGWLTPFAVVLAAAPALWFGLAYARAVRRGKSVALRATFLWAAAFVWFGATQAWRALPEPGPALAVAWVTAWVAAMAVQTWRF